MLQPNLRDEDRFPLNGAQTPRRKRGIAGKYPQGLQVHSWTDIENKTPLIILAIRSRKPRRAREQKRDKY
ncbi:MAG: hypothetical protein LW716_19810 [Microcystis sp. 53602_E8]|nr:hypothetical protein [Microcystis sp. 53602_E8]